MTFDQDPPDEADYRLDQESDERDAAEDKFVDGYAKAGAPLSSEERDVAAQAWFQAWTAGAAFERKWAATHQPTEPSSEHVCEECPTCGVHEGRHDKCCGCYDGVCCREPSDRHPGDG